MTKNKQAYLFLMPAMIVMFIGLFYPIGYSIYTSFLNWRLGMPLSQANFIGFEHYTWLFQDSDILNSLWVTLKFSISVVTSELCLGVLLALLLDNNIKGLNIIRTIFIMPMMVAPIVVGLLWQYLYHGEFGIFNHILLYFGFEPIGWLSSDRWSLFSIILSDIWQWTPFIFIMTVAALQSVPQSIIEAAYIDGASEWQVIRYIKIPMIVPTLIITLLLRLVDSFKVFEVIYIMTSGGPAGSTEVMSMAIYNQAFIDFELGRSAALSNLFLIGLIVLSFLFLIIKKMRNKYSLSKDKI